MRFILLYLLILGIGGLVEKIQAESLYTLDFSQAAGDPVEWFEARGWEEKEDMRRSLGERQGIDERVKLRELLRRVEMKVMIENDLGCL